MGNKDLICLRMEKWVIATDFWSVGWRGRNENLTTTSLVVVGVGVVLLSVLVVCTLASSESISLDSGLRLVFKVGVVMGGAGD